MKTIKLLIIAGCLSLLLFNLYSCITVIETEFPEFENKPVINAMLISGNKIGLSVSLTGKIDSIPCKVITDASVELYVDNDFVTKLTYDSDTGYYISHVVAETEKEYKCKVLIAGYEPIECVMIQPATPRIINAKFIPFVGTDENGWRYSGTEITFANDLNKDLFFEVRLMSRPSWDDEIYYVTDEIILKEGLPLALFSNKHITDSIWTVRISFWDDSEGLELRLVTEDYYKYKRSIYMFKMADAGLSGASAYYPIHSNIPNAYGIFAGYTSSQREFDNLDK